MRQSAPRTTVDDDDDDDEDDNKPAVRQLGL
jgi:hypothetical protein